MKTKLLLAGIAFTCLLFSCKENKNQQPTPTTDSSTTKDLFVKVDAIDTIGSTATVFRFMNWYKANQDSVSTVLGRIIKEDGSGTNEDSSTIEKISVHDLELYMRLLLSSGYISTTFTNNFKDFILREAYAAKTNHYSFENFFDADPIIHVQDDYFLNDLSKAKINTQRISGDKAVIIVDFFEGPELIFDLSLQKGKWLIDSIDLTPGLDLNGVWEHPLGETGSSDQFSFNSDNRTFEFRTAPMKCDSRIRSYSGNWTIKSDSLLLNIKKEEIWDGGQLVPSIGGDDCASEMKIINSKAVHKMYDKPQSKILLVSGIKSYSSYDNVTIKINGEEYFFVGNSTDK